MASQKILVVDDSPDLCEAITDVLSIQGYETLSAKGGAEGLEKALAEHPDLILLDRRMPDMDGFTVLKKLREDAWGKTAKVMMLTAVSKPETLPPELGITEDEYLMKTMWGMENIAKKVKEKLGPPTTASPDAP